jgi:hypothetical protein
MTKYTSFIEFLLFNEAAIGKEPHYEPVEVENAIEQLNEHARGALWMLQKNTPLYRGDLNPGLNATLKQTGFVNVDTSITERKSQDNFNYYTVILDNHPEYKDFPKRSRSFIGATKEEIAADFINVDDDTNRPFIMIPYDGAKIGMVHERDIWYVKITLFGKQSTFEFANEDFNNILKKPAQNIKIFEGFDKLLKHGDERAVERFKKIFKLTDEEVEKYSKTFLEEIWRAYSPKETGFTVHTTKTLPRPLPASEVWVGGKVMLIDYEMWLNMVNETRKFFNKNGLNYRKDYNNLPWFAPKK